jgi:hypothetical protein
MCFGCKRLVISATDQNKLMTLLPEVVTKNGQRTFDSENKPNEIDIMDLSDPINLQQQI